MNKNEHFKSGFVAVVGYFSWRSPSIACGIVIFTCPLSDSHHLSVLLRLETTFVRMATSR